MVSIRAKAFTNGHFTGILDSLAREEKELANLIQHLDKAVTVCGKESSAEIVCLFVVLHPSNI